MELQSCTGMVAGLWSLRQEILLQYLLIQNREELLQKLLQTLQLHQWSRFFLTQMLTTLEFHHKDQQSYYRGQGRELIRNGRVQTRSAGYTVIG